MSVQYRTLAFLGYPLYMVCTDGSFWSRNDTGHRAGIMTRYWKRLKLRPSGSQGYVSCTLRNSKGKMRTGLHRLILLAFVGPCPPGMEACHFPDRSRSNNKATNLRWGTKSDNQQDAIKHGTRICGQDSNLAKLREDQVREIRTRWITKRWTSMNIFAQWVAPDYGCSSSNVYMIVKYPDRYWAHVKI